MAETLKGWCPVFVIGAAQLVAWASSTYLPALVARPMARELGIAPSGVFAAISLSLLVMAACGPAVGRAIDRHGGRGVLCLSNLVLGLGLMLLGSCASVPVMILGWAFIGAGMALGLYDAAFAALVGLYGTGARGPITGVTLIGGFASTVGWSLGAWLMARWDWHLVCYFWAGLHLCVMLPLHGFGVPAASASRTPARTAPEAPATTQTAKRAFFLMAVFGASTAFVTSAMAAHLPGLLVATGAGAAVAILAASLLGPAQVAARLAEFGAARYLRVHPLSTARLATALHPIAGLGLALFGGTPFVAAAFAVLHGAGNGLITIAKGTLPLALFGATGYGARQGLLAVSQRLMQAAAPLVFALVLDHLGPRAAIALTASLSLLALAALAGLKREGVG